MTGDIVEKEEMILGRLTDLEMAFKVRMLMRNDLDHEAVCTGARDRIMYLSQQLQKTKRLDAEREFILGRPLFWCGVVARRLRSLGHEIEEKAESEQAYVINLMLNLYTDHGEGWRAEFDRLTASKD